MQTTRQSADPLSLNADIVLAQTPNHDSSTLDDLQSTRERCLPQIELSSVDDDIVYRTQLEHRPQPVNSLPFDILITIFEFAVVAKRASAKRSRPFEIVASHVSSHWRFVSLSTPILWSTMKACFPRPSPWLRTYIQRSGVKRTIYLTISLRASWGSANNYSRKSRPRPKDIFRILDECLHRVECLSIWAPNMNEMSLLVDYLEEKSLPALEHLQIDMFSNNVFDLSPSRVNSEGKTPCLRSLCVRNYGLLKAPIALTRLTVLRLIQEGNECSMDFMELRDVLNSLRLLTELDIVSYGRDGSIVQFWPAAGSQGSIFCPSLEIIRLRLNHQLLTLVSAPRLRHVELDGTARQFYVLFGPKVPILGARHCQVATLVCRRLPSLFEHDWPKVLFLRLPGLAEILPFVTHMELLGWDARHLVSTLCVTDALREDTPMWPSLQSLALGITHHIETLSAELGTVMMSHVLAGQSSIQRLGLHDEIPWQNFEYIQEVCGGFSVYSFKPPYANWQSSVEWPGKYGEGLIE